MIDGNREHNSALRVTNDITTYKTKKVKNLSRYMIV